MQYAALLSDLNTLSICPPEAALDLVSVHKTLTSQSQSQSQSQPQPPAQDQAQEPSPAPTKTTMTKSSNVNTTPSETSSDDNLRRANELVSLHYSVKREHIERGVDLEMRTARQSVARVLAELRG